MGTKARYYTCKTLAAQLDVAEVTVRKWCQHGRIPAMQFGKLWKIPAATIDTRIQQMEKGRGTLLTDATR
jgi:excisionase family DNA binding protein